MQRLASTIAALALLGLASCGGDEETTTTTTGASGATGVEGAAALAGGIVTAEDLIGASLPDQAEAVQELVAANKECAGVDAKPGSDFQVGVAITAAQATPNTPLSEIVAEQCG